MSGMSANAAMPAVRQKCIEIRLRVNWFVKSSQKQICKHIKSDVIRQYMSDLSRFLPSLNYRPGKIYRHCFRHNLGKDKLKS